MPIDTYIHAVLVLLALVLCMVLLAFLLKKVKKNVPRDAVSPALFVEKSIMIDHKRCATLIHVNGQKALYISGPHNDSLLWVHPQNVVQEAAYQEKKS